MQPPEQILIGHWIKRSLNLCTFWFSIHSSCGLSLFITHPYFLNSCLKVLQVKTKKCGFIPNFQGYILLYFQVNLLFKIKLGTFFCKNRSMELFIVFQCFPYQVFAVSLRILWKPSDQNSVCLCLLHHYQQKNLLAITELSFRPPPPR